jgi:hypothetical protein
LVASGYSQVPGIDFNESFAPVINDVRFRIMLIAKLTWGWMRHTEHTHMSMGAGSIYSTSVKQKMVTRSSKESEILVYMMYYDKPYGHQLSQRIRV